MNRRTVSIALCLAFVALMYGLLRQPSHAAEPVALVSHGPSYTSPAELSEASDLIIVGEVIGVGDGRTMTDPADPTAGIRTQLTELEVVRVERGSAGEVIVIEEEAMLLDGTPITVDGYAPLSVGDTGRYYLVASGDPEVPYFAIIGRD